MSDLPETSSNSFDGGSGTTATLIGSPDENIRDIAQRMVNLKSSEATSLLDYLKDTYDIEPSTSGVIVVEETVVDKSKPVQSTFDVVLLSVDPLKKIGVIKLVRVATGLGLKEAKDLVDTAPKTIKETLTKEDAEKLKKEIEDAGGVVELK